MNYPSEFLEFWSSYPRRIGKIAAFQTWLKAIKKFGATAEQLIEGAKRYAKHTDGKDQQYIKHPSSWLNAGCWEDEYEIAPQKSSSDIWETRLNTFKKTGLWLDQWGQKPETAH